MVRSRSAITRAHLEEDTAKLVHATDADGRKVSLVDFNRSGAPLMEIVTEPDIRTAEQARRYAEELQLLLRSIGASDADMERGQMRVEANVSLRPRGTEPFGTRVEVKNMNSFRAVERAIAFEIERQAAALDAGEPLVQETRGWSEERGETYRMRVKETSDDYRYFPEPDLPPLHLDAAWLARIRAELPELPAARRARYRDDARPEPVRRGGPGRRPGRLGAVRGDPGRRAGPRGEARRELGHRASTCASATRRPTPCVVAPAELGAIVAAVGSGSISRAQGREVLEAHAVSGEVATAIIADAGLPPDLGQRLGRRGGRRRPRGQPGRRRGLSRRQGAGGRLPRRAGHEGDPRPGQRGPGPGGSPRATRFGSTRGGLNGWGR